MQKIRPKPLPQFLFELFAAQEAKITGMQASPWHLLLSELQAHWEEISLDVTEWFREANRGPHN